MLSELNKKHQGKGLFAHEMYVFVKSFKAKLSLFSRQASDNMFPHFPILKKSSISRGLAAKYKLQIDSLADEFEKRFKCFKSLEIHFNVLSSPFSVNPYLTQKNLQLELVDLQVDNILKESFMTVNLLEFYGSLSKAAFPNLKDLASKMLTVFGSTYICEQAFSTLKISKSKNRTLLTDCNLKAFIRITTSKMTPNSKKLSKTSNSYILLIE
ncbi:General transcription factor II-I repeat domain-containing protein 2A [Cucumispora dikerogammari]|nr:General transcription factor II-I repeat domain-containing protein 2A [Cucumispora dikerogammari]